MNGNLTGVVLLGVFGIFIMMLFTTVGDAASLTTGAKINKIKPLLIDDQTNDEIVDINIGNPNVISTVDLVFNANVRNHWINIHFYDNTDANVGCGSIQIGSTATKTMTINLSDTVTNAEHINLYKIIITQTTSDEC